MSFYDALANNEPAVKELTDEALKKLAHELTENLRKNLSVDWSERESVRASLRLMVKRILRKCKYPPDMQEAAVELVLQQAQTLGDSWMRRAGKAEVQARHRRTAPQRLITFDGQVERAALFREVALRFATGGSL